MKGNSSRSYAASGTMAEVTHCLKCGSGKLAIMTFTCNKCEDCGFEQSSHLPIFTELHPDTLSEHKPIKEQE